MTDPMENPLAPSAETENKIRERAYYLWQEDGCPTGRQDEYWERARELQAMSDQPSAALQPNPAIAHPNPADDVIVEEASIQENLGEFPHGGLSDQGDRQETPMARRKGRGAGKTADDDAGGNLKSFAR